jgi:hypothetical protein
LAAVGSSGDAAMHQLAVAFFYTCAVLSITVAAMVFIGKVSADDSHHGVRYEIEVGVSG